MTDTNVTTDAVQSPAQPALKSLFDLALEKVQAIGAPPTVAGDDMGVVCWWGCQGVEIPVDDLKKIFTTLGLDPKSVPVPEARGALKDAADSLKLKYRLGRHRVDSERFAISFDVADLHQNGSATIDVAYKVEQVVEYNFTTKALTFKNSFMEQELRAAFTKYLTTLQSHDVRSAIKREVDNAKAITLRDRGGVYFIPAQHMDVVHKLKHGLVESVLAKMPGSAGSYFDAYTIKSAPEHIQTMTRSVTHDIEEELAAAEKDLAEIQEKIQKKEKVRGDTLDRRIADFGKIREKARAYADLLGMKQEVTLERLEKLQSSVLELAMA